MQKDLFLLKDDGLGKVYTRAAALGYVREIPQNLRGSGGFTGDVEVQFLSGTRDWLTDAEWAAIKPLVVMSEAESDLLAALELALREGVELAKQLEAAQARVRELEAAPPVICTTTMPEHTNFLIEPNSRIDWYYTDKDGTPRCRNCNAETILCVCGVRRAAGKFPKPAEKEGQGLTEDEFKQALCSDMAEMMQQPADTPPPSQAPTPATPILPPDDGYTHWQIVRVQRATFNSKTSGSERPMWRLFTEAEEQVNVFDHADAARDHKPMLDAAGYLSFFQLMQNNEMVHWREHPIDVFVSPSAKFWDLKRISPRAADAASDEPSVDLTPERLAVCQEAKEMLGRDDLVVFDTETTGIADDDEVVEIAGILLDPKHPAPSFQILIKPTDMNLLRRPGKRGKTAVDVHGIDEDMLKDAPGMGHPDVLNVLSEFLDKKAWATFNINFDERLLYQGLEAVGVQDGFPESRKHYCVQDMMNRFLGHDYTSLDESCAALKIPRSEKHHADADAEDALKVLKALAALVPEGAHPF
jgi:DNA polymerase III epsilon subunit-like protein